MRSNKFLFFFLLELLSCIVCSYGQPTTIPGLPAISGSPTSGTWFKGGAEFDTLLNIPVRKNTDVSFPGVRQRGRIWISTDDNGFHFRDNTDTDKKALTTADSFPTNPKGFVTGSGLNNAVGGKADTAMLSGKSPIFNSKDGFQIFGSFPDFIEPQADWREGHLALSNTGTVVNFGSGDSTFDHLSMNAFIWFRYSTDTVNFTFNASKVIYKDTFSNVGTAGGLIDDTTVFIAFGKYNSSQNIVQPGYITCNLQGNNVSAFVPVNPSIFVSGAQGAWFGKLIKGGGRTFLLFYKIGYTEVMEWTGSGFTSRLVIQKSNLSEPSLVHFTGAKWGIVTRSECSAPGDTCKSTLWKTDNNFATAEFVGYNRFNINPDATTRTPAEVMFDSLHNKVFVCQPTRRGLKDSLSIYMAGSVDSFYNNQFTRIAILPSPFQKGLREYGYPNAIFVNPNKIYWQFSAELAGTASSANPPYEVTRLFKFFTKYVPVNTNGGWSNTEGAGLQASASLQPGIFDFKVDQIISQDSGSIAGKTFQIYDPKKGISWVTAAEASAYISPSFDTTLAKGNTYSKPIVNKTNSNVLIADINKSVYFTAADTGSVIFKHLRVTTGINHKWIISGSNINTTATKASFTAEIDWQVLSSTGINSTTNSKVLVTALDGALPWDTVYVTQGTGDSTSLVIGSLANPWPAGYNVTLKRVELKGSVLTSSFWLDGFIQSFVKNWALIPNSKVKPPVVTPLTSATTLNEPQFGTKNAYTIPVNNTNSTGNYTSTNLVTALVNSSTTPITATGTLTSYSAWTVRDIFASSNITTTLSPSYAGQMWWLNRTDATSNNVVIKMASGNINGIATYTGLISQNSSVLIFWDGTNAKAR